MSYKRGFWLLIAILLASAVIYVTYGRQSASDTVETTWQYMLFQFNLQDFQLTALTDDDEMTTQFNEVMQQLEQDGKDNPSVSWVHALNYLGKFGWELTATETIGDNRIWTFKRPYHP